MDRIKDLLRIGYKTQRTDEVQQINFSGIDPQSLDTRGWSNLTTAIQTRNSNVFQELGIDDNNENRVNVISSYLRTELSDPESLPEIVNPDMELRWLASQDIQLVEHTFSRIFVNVGVLIQGNAYDLTSHHYEPGDLYRHMERTAWIGEVVLEEIYDRAQNDDPVAKEVFSTITPGAIYPAGQFHDIGRVVTQTSEHDKLGDEILEKAGVRKEVLEAIHSPVPTEGEYNPANDSYGQRILRLADVFAKVTQDENGDLVLRGSVEEVIAYSFERQVGYWEKEHNTPGSFWYGKTEEDVKSYCENERKVLETSEEWLQSMGIRLTYLIEKINQGIKGQEGQYYRPRP